MQFQLDHPDGGLVIIDDVGPVKKLSDRQRQALDHTLKKLRDSGQLQSGGTVYHRIESLEEILNTAAEHKTDQTTQPPESP